MELRPCGHARTSGHPVISVGEIAPVSTGDGWIVARAGLRPLDAGTVACPCAYPDRETAWVAQASTRQQHHDSEDSGCLGWIPAKHFCGSLDFPEGVGKRFKIAQSE